MADWRTRNFVPDSEDEAGGSDGSPGSWAHPAVAPVGDDFLDIDDILTLEDQESDAASSVDLLPPPDTPAGPGCFEHGGNQAASRAPQTPRHERQLPNGDRACSAFGEQESRWQQLPHLDPIAPGTKRPAPRSLASEPRVSKRRKPDIGSPQQGSSATLKTSKPREVEQQSPSSQDAEMQPEPDLPSTSPCPTSSPLTNVHSSQVTPPSLIASRAPSSNNKPSLHAAHIDRPTLPAALTPAHGAESKGQDVESHAERHFRPRKAIQQHPYTLESERFKKTAMSHGMKGIRYVERPEDRLEDGGDGSSTESFYSETDAGTFNVPVSPTSGQAAAPRPSTRPARQPVALQRQGSSDIGSSSPVKPRSPIKTKSRRGAPNDHTLGDLVDQTVELGTRDSDDGSGSKHHNSQDLLASVGGTDNQALQTISSSPSLSLASSHQRKTHRSASEERPDSHAVPVTDDGRSRLLSLELASAQSEEALDLDHRVTRVALEVPSDSSSTRHDISSSESEPESQLRQVRRKMKGVLPASWLKLDQKNKRPMPTNPLQVSFISGEVPGRGTARPIRPRHQASSKGAILVSSSSDSDTPSIPARNGHEVVRDLSAKRVLDQPLVRHRQPKISAWFEADESMEDNSIDRMAPARSQRATQCRARRKDNQTRVSEPMYGFHDRAVLERASAQQDDGFPTRNSLGQVLPVARPSLERQETEQNSVMRLMKAARECASQDRSIRIAARTALTRTVPAHRAGFKRSAKVFSHSKHAEAARTQAPTKRHSIAQAFTKRRPAVPASDRQPLRSVDGNRQSKLDHDRERVGPEPGSRRLVTALGASEPQHLAQKNKSSPRERLPTKPHGIFLGTLEPARVAPARLETLRAKKPPRLFSSSRPIAPGGEFLRPPSLVSSNLIPSPDPSTDHSPQVRRRKKPVPSRKEPKIHFARPHGLEGPATPCATTAPIVAALVPSEGSQRRLFGLKSCSAEYAVSFGIEPFPKGRCFDTTSVLGSGLVSRCLEDSKPSDTGLFLEAPPLDNASESWSTWNNATAAELDRSFDQLTAVLTDSPKVDNGIGGQPVLYPNLSSVLQYVTDRLPFFIATDQHSFLRQAHHHMAALTSHLQNILGSATAPTEAVRLPNMFLVPLLVQALLIAFRCLRLAADATLSEDHESLFWPVVDKLIAQTLLAVFKDGHSDLKLFSSHKTAITGASSSAVRRVKAEAFVVTLHVIEVLGDRGMSLWRRLACMQVFAAANRIADAGPLDQQWEAMFSVLPLFDVDKHGIVGDHRRKTDQRQNWDLAQQLLKPVFDIYHGSDQRQGTTFNGYVRSIFRRCFHLINVWAWTSCSSIVRTIFDFFTKTKLEFLRNEESRGPLPLFEKFDAVSHRDLVATSRDRSFHIFLRILWLALRSMRSSSSSVKGLSNLACRLTPNHARRFTKDHEARCSDLDALRNHHDLLVVLCRFVRLDHIKWVHLIENLVDFADSHKEACRINARSWSSLMAFQLTCEGEPPGNVQSLTDWMNRMLAQTLALHQHARVEVENHAAHHQRNPHRAVSLRSQEAVIASNQAQLEGLLIELVGFIRQALAKAPSLSTLRVALPTRLADVLNLFNPCQPRTFAVLESTLDAIVRSAECAESLQKGSESQASIDDLQDTEAPPAVVSDQGFNYPNLLVQSLYSLLTNAFAADPPIPESLALKIVLSWTSLVCLKRRTEAGDWTPYLGTSGQYSWSGLQVNEIVRKLAPYFFAEMIRRDESLYATRRLTVLEALIDSLVEQSVNLKYQNTFLAAILNAEPDDSLFKNCPFVRAPNSGHFLISESGLREHRIPFLTCVVSNMQGSLVDTRNGSVAQKRSGYRKILKSMAAAMRTVYDGLGSDENAKNDYVAFVHAVVDIVRLHGSDILEMEGFLTDLDFLKLSESQLDRGDVISNIRKYSQQLGDGGGKKRLASLILSTLRQAALQNRQEQVVEQLEHAVTGATRDERPCADSLPAVILGDICTAYIITADGCGWLLVSPLLAAAPTILDTWTTSLDGTDETARSVMETVIAGLLQGVKHSLSNVIHASGFPWPSSSVQKCTRCLEIIAMAVRPLDYIIRLHKDSWPLIALVNELLEIVGCVASTLRVQQNRSDQSATSLRPCLGAATGRRVENVAQSTVQELRKEVENNWRSAPHGMVEIKDNRGTWQSVRWSQGTVEEERRRFMSVAARFRTSVGAMPTFSKAFDDNDNDDDGYW